MKKLIYSLFLILISLTFIGIFSVKALTFGQLGNNQYYDIVFDKEGEAAVLARLDYKNNTETDLTEIIIEIPGSDVRIINVVQEKKNTCISYQDQNNSSQPYSSNYKYPSCEPKYSTIKYNQERLGGFTRVNLPLDTAVASQQSTSIIIYYKVVGFVEQKFGKNIFNFETIKSDVDIDNVRVAVNVVDELYLKEGKSEISYRSNNLPALERATNFSDTASPNLKSISQSIEKTTGFVKTTSSLDPWESFKVTGKYYPSYFYANWGSVVGVAAVFILLFVLILYIIKKEKKEG